jgi:type IX secretion system PorP/SprF family membrane protein
MKILTTTLLLISFAGTTLAQDPSFGQFFSSPLNVNPALTANIKSNWRVISNYRNQWAGSTSPYSTGTASFDTKLSGNMAENYVDENYRFGVGGMFMYDQSMMGMMKGNYGSLNISGNILLAEGSGADWNGNRIRHNNKVGDVGGAEHRIGVGFGAIYGNKRMDYSNYSFEAQFTGSNFNTSLPTGEASSFSMKPYFSLSAGILYNFISPNTNIDLGAAGFHLNTPAQSAINDKNQFLPTRYVLHGNMETILTDQLALQTNGIYQWQSGTSYFSIGGALGYYLTDNEEDNTVINAGLWYWSKNAVIPYVGFGYRNFQFGLSYDVTVSDLKNAKKAMKTYELSLIIRGDSKPNGIIPSPWK